MVTFRTLLNAKFEDEVMNTSDPDPELLLAVQFIEQSLIFLQFLSEQFSLTSDASSAQSIFCVQWRYGSGTEVMSSSIT
jgi:hypothetical protein